MAETLFDAGAVHAANLVELVEFADGGIVTKTLIDTDHVKLLLFAMDAGQSLSEHTAPFTATVQMIDGAMTFRVNGADHEMTPGDWLVMPRNAAHAVKATGRARFLLTLRK